ncbi:Glycosyltransferase family 9 (heptosyltransferase) [Faunimonas pinastri]|uniref:Glycosyltransferase family 9 (Heptosyltransferase) n=1 Tax=Faunimonas pinastri TaxID=1855383 RepID=A0A1H9PN48_9HYPH|nr:glycosyltransferase family 9 protein [Faunimonas pinastri]SER49229.1 Glycosyltransferase family 9 (heptosyltransferase) [Faunimonas pinastri]
MAEQTTVRGERPVIPADRKQTLRLKTRKIRRKIRERVHIARLRNAPSEAILDQLQRVLNRRDDLSDVFLQVEDVQQCRMKILFSYINRDPWKCSDTVLKFLDTASEIELLLGLDSLFQIWRFTRVLEIAEVIRARLTSERFRLRAHQLVQRSYLRSGQLSAAAAGLETDDLQGMEFGELLLRADIWDVMGRVEDATRAYELAIHRHSDNPTLHLRYGFHLLRKRRLADGIAHWGIAERGFGKFPIRHDIPVWRGDSLDGRRLLIFFEHGLGDMIQFARFLKPLLARWPTARVTCQMPAVLASLMARSFPGVEFLADLPPEKSFDAFVSVTQLPAVLECDSLEPASRYLDLGTPTALPALPGARKRIGICWRGHPREYELVRSIPLEDFSRLFAVPHIEFVVLLHDLRADEKELLATFPNVTVPPIKNFVELGQVVAACDAVLSVDTAVVHVAAAADRQVHLLSRPDSCWRWGSHAATSPWYPNVNILRHPGDMNWDVVLEEAARQLAA